MPDTTLIQVNTSMDAETVQMLDEMATQDDPGTPRPNRSAFVRRMIRAEYSRRQLQASLFDPASPTIEAVRAVAAKVAES